MRTQQEKTKLHKIADFADKSLLIVDDDNPLRDRLARAMEKKGFKVTQAERKKCWFGSHGFSLISTKEFNTIRICNE